jgi:hypothetical protein
VTRGGGGLGETGRVVKWLIIGLEVPLLTITGLFIGLRVSSDRLDFPVFLGMVVGGTVGLFSSSLILYVIALRTYKKDRARRTG